MDTIKHTIGDTFELIGTVTDPDNEEVAVPITDWIIEATARLNRKRNAGDLLLMTTNIEDAANGVYSVKASAEQTSAWQPRESYICKIRFTKPDGFRFTSPPFEISTKDDN